MSKPKEYEAVPRGHRRLWMVCYRIDGKRQSNGEWFLSRDAAVAQARGSRLPYWWGAKVVPIDVPIGVLPLPRAKSGER